VEIYGRVRTVLENSGTAIGALDTFIAAQALSLGATLVTSNTKEFARVSGLQIEDWRRLHSVVDGAVAPLLMAGARFLLRGSSAST